MVADGRPAAHCGLVGYQRARFCNEQQAADRVRAGVGRMPGADLRAIREIRGEVVLGLAGLTAFLQTAQPRITRMVADGRPAAHWDWWVINAHAFAINSRQPIVCVPVSVACRVLICVRFAKSAVRLFLGLRGPRHSSKQLNRRLREWSPMGARWRILTCADHRRLHL